MSRVVEVRRVAVKGVIDLETRGLPLHKSPAGALVARSPVYLYSLSSPALKDTMKDLIRFKLWVSQHLVLGLRKVSFPRLTLDLARACSMARATTKDR